MNDQFEEVIDTMDAEVFSGDSLVDPENRKKFREFLARWERRVSEMDEIFPDGVDE